MIRRAKQTKSQAFTLIEVMLAVAILGMISTMVWEGFAQTSRNKRRVEETNDRYHAVRVTMERISRELTTAYVSAQVNPIQSMRFVQTAFVAAKEGDGTRIDFTSFSHVRLMRDSHESDQNEISYFLARDPENASHKVLARREQNRIDDDPRRGGHIEVLMEDVSSFELEFFDPLSSQWVTTWDTTQASMQQNRLPTQVKIRLSIPQARQKNRVETFMTRVSLPLVYGLNHATYNP